MQLVRIVCRVTVFACWALISGTAQAGNLTLLADDIVWNPQTDGSISPPLLIRVENDTSPDSDLLQGWLLRLQIVASGTATGTLEFNSRALATSDYLLEGRSGGLGGSISASEVFGFDDDLLFTGVEVPLSGKALFQVDFSTPDNAIGTFNIVALPGLANTQWSDGNFEDRDFANVPFGAGEPVVLATVTVVPEPSMIGLATLALGLFLVYARRRGPPTGYNA